MKALLPIFVVSLKQDIDRREHINVLMKNNGLDFTFFDATDGSKIDLKKLSCYDVKETIKCYKKELTHGEIGCYLSHFYLLTHIVKKKYTKVLILEDDATFDHNLVLLLENIQTVAINWDILLLCHGERLCLPAPMSLWFPKKTV